MDLIMRYICEQFVKVINFEHIVSLKKKKKVRERGEFLSQIIFSLSLSLLLNTKNMHVSYPLHLTKYTHVSYPLNLVIGCENYVIN